MFKKSWVDILECISLQINNLKYIASDHKQYGVSILEEKMKCPFQEKQLEPTRTIVTVRLVAMVNSWHGMPLVCSTHRSVLVGRNECWVSVVQYVITRPLRRRHLFLLPPVHWRARLTQMVSLNIFCNKTSHFIYPRLRRCSCFCLSLKYPNTIIQI